MLTKPKHLNDKGYNLYRKGKRVTFVGNTIADAKEFMWFVKRFDEARRDAFDYEFMELLKQLKEFDRAQKLLAPFVKRMKDKEIAGVK